MRIGDLATASGLTTKTIRFYEQTGLLPAPPRTSGGYRDYPEQTEARLAFIRDAQDAGLTLADVTVLIDQRLVDIERRMAELAKTRDALRGLARRAAATDPATCGQDEICTILGAPESPDAAPSR